MSNLSQFFRLRSNTDDFLLYQSLRFIQVQDTRTSNQDASWKERYRINLIYALNSCNDILQEGRQVLEVRQGRSPIPRRTYGPLSIALHWNIPFCDRSSSGRVLPSSWCRSPRLPRRGPRIKPSQFSGLIPHRRAARASRKRRQGQQALQDSPASHQNLISLILIVGFDPARRQER